MPQRMEVVRATLVAMVRARAADLGEQELARVEAALETRGKQRSLVAALAEFGLLLTGEGGDMSEFFKVSESGRVMGLNMVAIQESVSAAAEKRVADAEMPTCRQVDR